MLIRLINIKDIMNGTMPDNSENYDYVVIRNLPKNVKTSLRFNDFEGDIEETRCREKYAICRRIA